MTMTESNARPALFFTDLPWERWPAVLPRTYDDDVLPLRIGIGGELEALLPDDPAVRKAFRRTIIKYTRSVRYLEAVAAEGAIRYDIDCNPSGEVSELDRHSAALLLFRRTLAERKRARRDDGAAPMRPEAGPPPETPGPSVRERILRGRAEKS